MDKQKNDRHFTRQSLEALSKIVHILLLGFMLLQIGRISEFDLVKHAYSGEVIFNYLISYRFMYFTFAIICYVVYVGIKFAAISFDE